MSFFNTFLLVFAGIALFVGAFIIFNTFSIIVTQRQKEMALLRAIGASGKQVMRSVMLEATIVGVVASVVGLAAGIGVAAGLKQLLSGFGLDLPAGGLAVTTSTVITSLIVGTVVTLASAWFPARKAGKVPPIAAMRDVALDRTGASPKRMVIGGVVTAAGVGSLLAGLAGEAMPLDRRRCARHLRRCRRAGAGARPPGCPAARLPDAQGDEDERLAGSAERDAQPEADRGDRRGADDRCRPRRLHHHLRRVDQGSRSTAPSTRDFNGDFVIDSGSFEAAPAASATSWRREIAARPEFAAVTSDRGNTGEARRRGEHADQLGHVDRRGDARRRRASRAIRRRWAPTASPCSTTYAKEHHLQLGSTRARSMFAQGDTSLTVKAIYGNATWVGDAFVDHAVADRLGLDPLDSAMLVAPRRRRHSDGRRGDPRRADRRLPDGRRARP